MNKTSFTPGPWENEGEDHFADMPFIRIGKGRPICDVIPPIDLVDMDGESRSNAHLIAAAPELYGALEAARSQLRMLGTPDDPVNNHIIGLCDAAAAKARGEIP